MYVFYLWYGISSLSYVAKIIHKMREFIEMQLLIARFDQIKFKKKISCDLFHGVDAYVSVKLFYL